MHPEPEAADLTGKPRLSWLLTASLLAALVGAASIAFSGITSRAEEVTRLRQTAAERAIPTVDVAPPSLEGSTLSVRLPGRLQPYAQADLFARVSGYIASWKSDIGAKVKAGDVLAEIDAPDLDQQLFQARSDLANAVVNERLSSITNTRFQALLPNHTISQQTADDKAADLAAKQALVKSAQANVDRLVALTKYKQIVAPFDGTVTARNTDLGALINVGSTSGSPPLFVVSSTKKLRLYINVPQTYAPQAAVGTTAYVVAPERPNRTFVAKVEATSGSVDLTTGTIRMQLAVDNAKGELLPGAYVNVVLKLPPPRDVFTVPASALIVGENGLSVAVVKSDGTAALKKVAMARDLGKSIEITSGLSSDDRVIQNPPDGLAEGDIVRLMVGNHNVPTAAMGTPQAKS